MQQLNWGIIGVGDVCEVKSGPAFNKIAHSKLVAVMRRNGHLASDYAQRHQVPKWYDNAQALINDPEINMVYIATPPSSHAVYTQMVAQAGKPVYVEKPMACSFQECEAMVQICQQHNVPLFVAYYRRAMPNFLAIKQWLAEELIGDIRFVDIQLRKTIAPDYLKAIENPENWRTNPAISGGGHFHDVGSHQLDMMDFLFGEIVSISGYATNQAGLYPADDLVMGHFRCASGVVGQGTWCFTVGESSQEDRTTIYGSKGSISFPFFGNHSVSVHLDGKQPITHHFDIAPNIQQHLIQTIADDLRGVGTCPSTGTSAARTNRAMEWFTN